MAQKAKKIRSTMEEEISLIKEKRESHLIQRESISKYEIHRAFNIAIFVIVPTHMIIECILCTQELAT